MVVIDQDTDLYEALAVYGLPEASGPRLEVEALLLAGSSDVEIADEMGYTPQTIRLYHDCFFDIRDRLHTTTLIHVAVVCGRHEDTATVIRRTAFCAGKLAALALLHPTFGGRPKSKCDVMRFLSDDFCWALKIKAMIAMRTTTTSKRNNQVKLMTSLARLKAIDARHRECATSGNTPLEPW